MGDDFQLVKSKKRRCKPRQAFGVPSLFLEDVESVHKKSLETTTEFEKTSFCNYFIKEINKSLDKLEKEKIDVILSYGLGKFSQSLSSLHQLSALIIISKTFDSPVIIFDPLFDSTELTILKKLNFEVIPENEEGEHSEPKYSTDTEFITRGLKCLKAE